MKSRVFLSGLVLAGALILSSLPASAHNSADMFSPVRDVRGNPVRSLLSGQCVLTHWSGSDGECLGMRREIALEDRTVYFDFNKSELTSEGRNKLDGLTNILRGDKDVKSLSIVGYADRIGSRDYNASLSKKRAMTVRDYLIAQGFPKVDLAKLRWFGKDRPSAKCDADLAREDMIACLQPDRRVEVEVNYVKTVKTSAKKAVKKKAPAAPAKEAPKKQ
jgi:outer membrane protein OmpA-like peptidoglycan-associated protein